MRIGYRITPGSLLMIGVVSLLAAVLPGESSAWIVCNGDCTPSGWVPEQGGEPLEFELALRAEEGQNLALYSDGGIYVYGDIHASGDVTLRADDSIWIKTPIDSASVTFGSEAPIPGGIDAGPDPGGIQIAAGGFEVALANVVISLCALDPTCQEGDADVYTATGDIYLDVTGIQLAQLSLDASFIQTDSTPVAFVPEPRTAFLLAAGLAGLAVIRRRQSEARGRS